MKNDRKPCFQGLHAGLVNKALAVVVAAIAVNMAYGATMYLSTENVKKSLLWLSPPVLKWFLTETDLSTLLRG